MEGLFPKENSIVNTVQKDLDMVFSLFDSSVAYQLKHQHNVWPRFNREFIETEIEEGRQFKILSDASVLGVFSVLYSDPVIWGDRDREPSVYLHRIAVNPLFKGGKLMPIIRDWAKDHARIKGKQFVRMDTWGDNASLRKYYIKCGFNYIGQRYLSNLEEESSHYGGPCLSLFQIEI